MGSNKMAKSPQAGSRWGTDLQSKKRRQLSGLERKKEERGGDCAGNANPSTKAQMSLVIAPTVHFANKEMQSINHGQPARPLRFFRFFFPETLHLERSLQYLIFDEKSDVTTH